MCETRLYLRGGKPGSLGESCFSPCLDLSECIFPSAARVRRPCAFSHVNPHVRTRVHACIASTNYGHSISAFDRFTSQRRDKKARSPPLSPLVSTPSTPPPPLRARDVETQLIPFESERNRRDAINRGVASEEAVV